MASITLKQLEAFVAVADLGTFRRAAERLNTTQPNISNRIAGLEAQLRLTLMERDAGSVRLTARGAELLEEARGVLARVDALVSRAGGGALAEGTLRLGVSEMVAQTWLRPFLRDMGARCPGVDVELTVDLSANLSKALFARDLDLVIQNGPFDRAATVTEPLGRSPYVWVAAPALGLGPGPVGDGDLAGTRVLTHAPGTAPFRQLDGQFRGSGVRLVPCANIGICLVMALDGLGVACLPEPMVTAPLAEGRLVRLDYPWRPDDLVFAARHMQAHPSAALREAIGIARRLSPPEDSDDLSS